MQERACTEAELREEAASFKLSLARLREDLVQRQRRARRARDRAHYAADLATLDRMLAQTAKPRA